MSVRNCHIKTSNLADLFQRVNFNAVGVPGFDLENMMASCLLRASHAVKDYTPRHNVSCGINFNQVCTI